MIEVVVAIFLIYVFRKVLLFFAMTILILVFLITVTAIVYPATQSQPTYAPTVFPSQVIVTPKLPIPALKPLDPIYMVNGILATDELTPLGR